METIITNEFGIENGNNFILVRCYANSKDLQKDKNCLKGESRHIGIGYMKEEQVLLVSGDVEEFLNEGCGITCSVKKVMSVKKFKKAFNNMCDKISNGESVIW